MKSVALISLVIPSGPVALFAGMPMSVALILSILG